MGKEIKSLLIGKVAEKNYDYIYITTAPKQLVIIMMKGNYIFQ